MRQCLNIKLQPIAIDLRENLATVSSVESWVTWDFKGGANMPRDTISTAMPETFADVKARRYLRHLGGVVTFVIGPALAAFAALGLGMGPLETIATLVLISVWLGPKLMGVFDD